MNAARTSIGRPPGGPRRAAGLAVALLLAAPLPLGLSVAAPVPLALVGIHLRLDAGSIAFAPSYVEAGDNLTIDITVVNDGDAGANGTIDLYVGDPLSVAAFASAPFTVGPASSAVATTWLNTTDLVGIQTITARIAAVSPPETGPATDNEAEAPVRIHHSVVDMVWDGGSSFLVNESYPHTGFVTVRGGATLTVGPSGALFFVQRRDREFDILVEEQGTLRIAGGNISSAFALGVELRDNATLVVEAGGLLAASVVASGSAAVQVYGGSLASDTIDLTGGSITLASAVVEANRIAVRGSSVDIEASAVSAGSPIAVADAPSAAFNASTVKVASAFGDTASADAAVPGVSSALAAGEGPFQPAVHLSGTTQAVFRATTVASTITIAGQVVTSTVPIQAVGAAAGTVFRAARIAAADPTGAPVLNASIVVRHRSNESTAASLTAASGSADIELPSTFLQSGAAFMIGQYKVTVSLGSTSSPDIPFNFALFPDLSPASLLLEVPVNLPLYEPWSVAPADNAPQLISAATTWDTDASFAHNIEVQAPLTLSAMTLSLDQSRPFERFVAVTNGGRLDLEGSRIQSDFPFNVYVLNGTDASFAGGSSTAGNLILHRAGNFSLAESRLTGAVIGDALSFACSGSYLWSPRVDLSLGDLQASECVVASPSQISLSASGRADLDRVGLGTTFEPFDAARAPSLSFDAYEAATAEAATSSTGNPTLRLEAGRLNASWLTVWTDRPFAAALGPGSSTALRLRVAAAAFEAELAGTTLTLERGAVEGGAPTDFTGDGTVALRAFLTSSPSADPAITVDTFDPVSVYVVDGVGLPVPGARVVAVAAGGAVPQEEVTTDAAGAAELLLLTQRLSLGTLTAGPTYRVNATRDDTASATATWNAAQAPALEFTLARNFGAVSGEAAFAVVSPLANGQWRVLASNVDEASLPAFLGQFREGVPPLTFTAPVFPASNATVFVAADFVFSQGPERATLPMAQETAVLSLGGAAVATILLDADGTGQAALRAPATGVHVNASLSITAALLGAPLAYDASFDLTPFALLRLEGGITKPNATFKPSEAITVTGFIRDEAGAAVPGATVTLVYGAGAFSRTVQAAADGSFVFRILAPTELGSYELRVSASARDSVPAPEARFGYQVSNVGPVVAPPAGGPGVNLVGLMLAVGIAVVGGVVFFYAYAQRRVGRGEFVVCGNCDKPTLATSRKCNNCGVEFEANLAKCSKCSSWISPEALECPQCHTRFSREVVAEERDLGPAIPEPTSGVRDGFDIPEGVPLTAKRADAGRLEDLEFRLPGTTDTLDLGEKGSAPSFTMRPESSMAPAAPRPRPSAGDAPLERTELPRVDETDGAVRDVSPMEGGAPTTKQPVSLGTGNIDLSRTTAAATATKPDAVGEDEIPEDVLRELLMKAAPELSGDVLPAEVRKELQEIARGEAPVASEKRVAAEAATAGHAPKRDRAAPAVRPSERPAEAPEKSKRTAFDVFSKPTKQVPAGYEKKGGGPAAKDAAAKGAPVCPNCGGNWVVQRDGKNSCRVCGTRW